LRPSGRHRSASRFGSSGVICNPKDVSAPTVPSAPERTAASPLRWALAPVGLLWAWGIGVLLAAIPAFVNWMTAPEDAQAAATAVSNGAGLWAAAQAVPVEIQGIPVSLLPWGYALIPLTLFAVGTAWVLRSLPTMTRKEWLIGLGLVALLTAGLGAIIGSNANTSSVSFDPVQVAGHAGFIAALGYLIGTAARPVYRQVVLAALSADARRVLRAVIVAIFGVLGVAAIVLAVAMTATIGAATDLLLQLETGEIGALLLTLIQLGYLPVLLLWAVAYISGAGFVLAEQVLISPFIAITVPVDVPPVPMLTVIPTSASPIAWALPLLFIGVGVLTARVLLRGATTKRLHRIGLLALTNFLAAFVIGLLASLSTGSLGVDRLAAIGPTPYLVTWLVFAQLCIGALPIALLRQTPKMEPGGTD
jgi:hypothetical protein